MPALWHSLIAAGTSGRSGSAKATRPRRLKSKPSASIGQALWAQLARATASTRRPRPAICCACCAMACAAGPGKRHSLATASGAPLTATMATPSSPSRQTWVIAGNAGVSPYSCTRRQDRCSAGSFNFSRPRSSKACSIASKGCRSLASNANSSSSSKSAGQGCVVATQRCGWAALAGSSSNSATAIRFSVRVPVLSVHSTVAEPSASIVAARRVSTCWRDKRQAPMAMKTVRIRKNSCGSNDIAKVMPASRPASQLPRCRP